MSELLCWNCGENLDDIPRPISRHATCGNCFNELHCCRLCRHYDPKRTMQCFEDRADPPLQKENANFCDFYSPQFGAFEGSIASKSESAQSELNVLFGKGEPTKSGVEEEHEPAALSDEEAAKKRLDDLFN